MRPSFLTIVPVALAALTTAGPAGAAPEPAPPPHPVCPTGGTVQTSGGPLKLTPLDQLPPGVITLTVLRRIGGCSITEVKIGGRTYYVPGGLGQHRTLPVGRPQPLR